VSQSVAALSGIEQDLAAAKLGIREELAIDLGTPVVLSLCRLATVSGGDEN
jgi:hypothetical protein